MEGRTLTIPVEVDMKGLAALRVLLSQLGFAIDNYLLEMGGPCRHVGNEPEARSGEPQ